MAEFENQVAALRRARDKWRENAERAVGRLDSALTSLENVTRMLQQELTASHAQRHQIDGLRDQVKQLTEQLNAMSREREKLERYWKDSYQGTWPLSEDASRPSLRDRLKPNDGRIHLHVDQSGNALS